MATLCSGERKALLRFLAEIGLTGGRLTLRTESEASICAVAQALAKAMGWRDILGDSKRWLLNFSWRGGALSSKPCCHRAGFEVGS